jgi:xanthine dehydrogenase YagS FAD-binding subunit
MKPFEYATPATIEEAVALLGSTWGQTEILAGGTDLLTSLKQQITTPKQVVSLKRVKGLSGIKSDRQSLRIGAMTPLAEVAGNKAVTAQLPSLVTAIAGIGSPQIINAGTIGGDLCQRPRCWYYRQGYGLLAKDGEVSLAREGDNRHHAIFATDGPALFVNPSSVAPPLIALGATLVLTGPKGKTREVAAAEFFRVPQNDNERENVLQSNEILTEIQIPLQGLKNATYEVRHRSCLDWPYVTASVAFKQNGGAASDARVVLGHVAAVPWQAKKAAALLNGSNVNEGLGQRCGNAAAEGAKPLSRNDYKVQLVKTAVKRAILAAAG